MGKKKTNWDVLSGQNPKDTTRYRDVYDDQQLERSDIQEKQSPTLRVILSIIITVFAMALVYCLISVGSFVVTSI